MGRTSGETACLICFECIQKLIFVPSDGPEKIFTNCITYLHSTLTKETLQDVKQNKENQLPLCKSCFDSALRLTQLSEQLTIVQKDISDLTVAFSMAAFYRRSQVYSLNQMQNNSQSFNNSSIIEFNEACLPPNLFSTKNENKSIHHRKSNNQRIVADSFRTPTDIVLLNHEIRDLRFDKSPISESSITIDDLKTEIALTQENLDQQWIQPTIDDNGNHASVSEMRIVHSKSVGGNESKSCAIGQNNVQLTRTDLINSIKMPDIILERINIDNNKIYASIHNSFQTKSPSHQPSLDVAPFNDDEVADPSYSINSSGGNKPRKNFNCEKRVPRRSKENIGKPLTCSFCQKTFRVQSHLEIHERAHTGEKPFQCSFCETRFSRLDNLRVHEETHTGQKRFECSICKTRFRHSGSLKGHITTHTGQKLFECSFCKTRFSRLNNLRRHEKTHTGQKRFECSFCKTRFSRLSNLRRHEKTHTGQKRFECSICKTRFRLLSHLKRHISTHTGESNPLYVAATIINKSRKDIQQKSHSNSRGTFECSFCRHKCGSPEHLKLHENFHTAGVMDFKCSFCQIRFATAKDKIVHEKSHSSASEQNDEDFIVGI